MIGDGSFDRILVRPRSAIFQVLGSKIEFSRIGRLLQAIAMFIYGVGNANIVWTYDKMILVCLMIIGGTVIFASLYILYAGICFFTLEGLEIFNITTNGAREYGKYPVSIYGKGILKFCTYGIPFTLFQYYPLLYILDMDKNLWYLGYPIIGCLFFIPCYLVWHFGLRHYASTGS